jgi:DNA-binding response OmpR family regulator
MRRPGAVVRRETLIEQGWVAESDANGASLYDFIRSLRSEITQPGEKELLHTVRGVGYSLRSEPV